MNEKFYLGISLGCNSSACVVSDKRGLVAAVSQERMNGQKNTKELPFDAIFKCLEIADTDTIEKIAISHYENISNEYFEKYQSKKSEYTIACVSDWKECIINVLKRNKIKIVDTSIFRTNHHVAHAYSTFGFYNKRRSENYYMITSDGFGDGFSATILDNEENVPLSAISLKNSIALVYQFVTGALGFKMHQHEGKITGLAAFGKPIHLQDFEDLYDKKKNGNGLNFKTKDITLNDEEIKQVYSSNIVDFDNFLKLKKAVFGLVNELTESGAKREDIAASVQAFAEKYTLLWIENYCTEKDYDCYLAGGLFANVKLNQKIKDSGIFRNVFVCPAMGDEGTCVGAVMYMLKDNVDIDTTLWQPKIPQKCGHMRAYDDDVTADLIHSYLDDKGLSDDYVVTVLEGDTISEIANKLANNKIVCLMRNKMEFGPRALCHTSILYNCDTKETNDWLNKKLSRTEFMPFAPVCREEVADDLFINLDGGRDSARFMTMTFDCTQEFIENYPAACHIDNTARPQIVHFSDDPFMWHLLRTYQGLTDKKALINTSFNLHNWPIIAKERVALDSWIKSDTDCLVIGDVMVEKVKGAK